MSLVGHTFSVRRLQTHDGPGLRTTVFMKGCPLRCAWCHNPESWSARSEVWWLEGSCIACGACVPVCSRGAIPGGGAGYQPDRALCVGCGACVEVCPAKTREALRQDWTVDALFDEVIRDRAFYDGGGITVSGGEPGAQAPFVAAFLARCRREGLHTALDTCGAMRRDAFEALLPHCDLVLYDLKMHDPERHRWWTGQDNVQVLANARALAERIRAGARTELWIRTPLIPGATDSEENLSGLGALIREELRGAVSRWELCAFNNLCADKYERLGLTWAFSGQASLDLAHGRRLLAVAAKAAGLPERAVTLKGGLATRAPAVPPTQVGMD